MQTVKTIVVIACMAICATTIQAQSAYKASDSGINAPLSPSFKVYASADTGSVFRIMLDNPGSRELHLSISHAVLGNLYDTTVKEKQFVCRYNFSGAEDGRYRIIVRYGKEKISKAIDLNTITTVSRQLNVQ